MADKFRSLRCLRRKHLDDHCPGRISIQTIARAGDAAGRFPLPAVPRPLIRKIIRKIRDLKRLSFRPFRQTIVSVHRARGSARHSVKGDSLDKHLPMIFACVCVVARRELGMRPYNVQLIGGIELHGGTVAEMATGEGKTLVATLPATLNGIAGRGVHIVTVNDYLAQRDAELMRPVYKALGLSVGVIISGLEDNQRRDAYRCDIVYGTNKEFGFDYLRDQIKLHESAAQQKIDTLALFQHKASQPAGHEAIAFRDSRRGGFDFD